MVVIETAITSHQGDEEDVSMGSPRRPLVGDYLEPSALISSELTQRVCPGCLRGYVRANICGSVIFSDREIQTCYTHRVTQTRHDPRVVDLGERPGSGFAPGSSGGARERILHTAYDLFSRHGVRPIGVDRIVAESGVAKISLYRHFHSKDELVVAFLRRREELWSRAWLQSEVERRASAPDDQLLAVFDVFAEWFQESDFEGCSFINVLLEFEERSHPVHVAAVAHLAAIRDFLRDLAEQAGVRDPDRLCRQWHILMKGSIIAAGEGDTEAAGIAREVAALLLVRELARPTSVEDGAGLGITGATNR